MNQKRTNLAIDRAKQLCISKPIRQFAKSLTTQEKLARPLQMPYPNAEISLFSEKNEN